MKALKKKENILAGAMILMVIAVAVVAAFNVHLAPVLNLVLLAGLIAVTTVYAYSTMQISDTTREQAEMASRPIIIQKCVHKKRYTDGVPIGYFSHFETYNAGNGPAIELEISTVYEKRDYLHAIRETFLRAGDSKEFYTDLATLKEKTTYHLVCEYQGIFSRVGKETWYQTWLPFEFAKASAEGQVYVTAGELEFKEVSKEERINAFRGKPK